MRSSSLALRDRMAGELPAELARFARRLGFVAQHYNRGTVQQLEYHLQQGHVVILMLNYKNGGGHLVNLLGFDTEGDQITGFRIRNPWGFDESIPTKRFLNEWRHMRQSRNSIVGSLLPVFDAGFAVLASSGTLPTMTFLDWLHSAPVDLLVSSMNGIGGSASTMCNHHWLPALGQLFGNCVGTLGGLAAYTIGNLVGLNLVFVGDRVLSAEKSSVVGHVLSVLGSSFSVSGGLVAAGVQLIRKPLIIAGEMFAGRDALCETICDTNLPRLHSALARAEAGQISRQLRLLRSSFHGDNEKHAAERLLMLSPGSVFSDLSVLHQN